MTAPRAIHLDAGGRPRCGHPHAACLTRDAANVTCGGCLNLMGGGSTLGFRHSDWQLRPHGTRAAYRRHKRLGTRPCEACLQAERRAWAERADEVNARRRLRMAS